MTKIKSPLPKAGEKTWFITGSFPELSAAEIAAVLNLKTVDYSFNPPLFIVDKIESNLVTELINRLGGTVKIAYQKNETNNEDELISEIVNILEQKEGKVVFGLNYYNIGTDQTKKGDVEFWGKSIKKILREKGKSSRYIYKNESTLSSATVLHNNLIKKGADIIIAQNQNKYLIAETVALQPFEDWGRRDFGRPSRDDFSGMLPPKIARIMINLAVTDPTNKILLDPFCGSGTIISEAALMNFKKIIGSDVSNKAIQDTKNNLKWLKKYYTINTDNIEIKQLDVSELSKYTQSADAIITEPYLGPPRNGRETLNELKKTSSELKALYLKTLEQFEKILSPHGTIIMVIPCFRYKGQWINIDLTKELKKIGLVTDPLIKTKSRQYDFLLYARANQRVGREIWRFKKNSS